MNDSEDIGLEIIRSQQRFDTSKIDSYFKYFSDDENVFDGIFTHHVIRFTQPRALNYPLEFSPTIRFHDNESPHSKLWGICGANSHTFVAQIRFAAPKDAACHPPCDSSPQQAAGYSR